MPLEGDAYISRYLCALWIAEIYWRAGSRQWTAVMNWINQYSQVAHLKIALISLTLCCKTVSQVDFSSCNNSKTRWRGVEKRERTWKYYKEINLITVNWTYITTRFMFSSCFLTLVFVRESFPSALWKNIFRLNSEEKNKWRKCFL